MEATEAFEIVLDRLESALDKCRIAEQSNSTLTMEKYRLEKEVNDLKRKIEDLSMPRPPAQDSEIPF